MKPCKECPYRRTSAPGYLGASSYQPEAFIMPYLEAEGLKHPCHMQIDWEQSREAVQRDIAEAPVCAGFATLCKNMAKLPRNPENAKAVREATRDTETFFANLQEFIQHHEKQR